MLEDENGLVKVEKWLSNYIKKPNAFVKLYLKEVLSKVNMNRRLKEAIGMDLIIKLQASVEQPTRKYKLSSKRFPIKMYCNEILQDLVYITLMETVFNPEIEENKYSFVELTQMTKTRLDSLIDAQYALNFMYSDLFEKCYNAKEGLVSKELERYGWEYTGTTDEEYKELKDKLEAFWNTPEELKNGINKGVTITGNFVDLKLRESGYLYASYYNLETTKGISREVADIVNKKNQIQVSDINGNTYEFVETTSVGRDIWKKWIN